MAHTAHSARVCILDYGSGNVQSVFNLVSTLTPSAQVSNDPAAIRDLLGMDYRSLLHGEQAFTYHRMAFAGDRLTFEQRIEDIYEKKGGLLEFVVRQTRVTNQRGELVAELRGVTVVRNRAGD